MFGKSTKGKYFGGLLNKQEFGDVTIIRDGLQITIPKSYLFKDGTIKKKYLYLINKKFQCMSQNNIA